MPIELGWYWVLLDDEEQPQVCQLENGVLWTTDRELGMTEKSVGAHCRVWSEAIQPPNIIAKNSSNCSGETSSEGMA